MTLKALFVAGGEASGVSAALTALSGEAIDNLLSGESSMITGALSGTVTVILICLRDAMIEEAAEE